MRGKDQFLRNGSRRRVGRIMGAPHKRQLYDVMEGKSGATTLGERNGEVVKDEIRNIFRQTS